MDIGPVNAVRAVPAVRPSPPGSGVDVDLAGVFAVEFRDEQPEDSYSLNRKAVRGIEEDEDRDGEPAEPEPTYEDGLEDNGLSISFFA